MEQELKSRLHEVRTQLSSPDSHRFKSVDDVCRLLIPPLALLGLLDDTPQLCARYAWSVGQDDGSAERDARDVLLKRHLAALQLLILQHPSLLPDWEEQLERADLLDIVVGRYFVTITLNKGEGRSRGRGSTTPVNPICSTVGATALRSLAAFFSADNASLMPAASASRKGKARLHPRSLEFAVEKAARIISTFDLSLLYAYTFDAMHHVALGRGRSGSRALTLALEKDWRDLVDLIVLKLPAKAANACAMTSPNEVSVGGQRVVVLPEALDRKAVIRRTCHDFESLLRSLAMQADRFRGSSLSSAAGRLAAVLDAMIRAGAFPISTTAMSAQLRDHSQPSFWSGFWRTLVSDLAPSENDRHERSAPSLRLLRSAIRKLAGLTPLVGSSSTARGIKPVVASLVCTCQALLLSDGSTNAQYDLSSIEATARVLNTVLGPLSASPSIIGSSSDRDEVNASDDESGREPEISDSSLYNLVISELLLPLPGWSPSLGAAIAQWAGLSVSPSENRSANQNKAGLQRLAMDALALFADNRQITIGQAEKQHLLASIILLAPASAGKNDQRRISQAISESDLFFAAVSGSLNALRPPFRLLGMLIAEKVTAWAATPKSAGVEAVGVAFGREAWEGDSEAHMLCRDLRQLMDSWGSDAREVSWVSKLGGSISTAPHPPHSLGTSIAPVASRRQARHTTTSPLASEQPRTAPKIEVIGGESPLSSDDDDDLIPFAAPTSNAGYDSKTNGPTMEELETGEIGLHATRPKRPRDPVYVQEVSEYLRDSENAERCAVGLERAVALVRRKAGWGTELDENAVDLLFALTNLQDTFELPDFEAHRQAALNALVACAPKRVAPSLVEQLFSQSYSLAQRVSMLNALAIGSRELAGLEIPSVKGVTNGSHARSTAAAMPSSRSLPQRLHDSLVRLQIDEPADALAALSGGIARQALTHAREDAEQAIPEASREKMLTVDASGTTTRRNTKALLQRSAKAGNPSSSEPRSTYHLIAIDYFIMPLINRMWLYLRDVSSVNLGGGRGGVYQGTGWATILDPLMLSRFAQTLAVLIFPARNAPSYSAVLAPEVLALAVTLHASDLASHASVEQTTGAALLELVLVVLDACVALDGGHSLTRSHGAWRLVMEIKDWAEGVFNSEGHQGGFIRQAGRAAAGVLIRTEEIASRWRGAVVSF